MHFLAPFKENTFQNFIFKILFIWLYQVVVVTCRIFSYSMGTLPLEKGMATHFSILTWQIPWTEESTGLQPVGSQSGSHNCETNTFLLVACGI